MPLRKKSIKVGPKSRDGLAATIRSDATPMLLGRVCGLDREQLKIEVADKGAGLPLGSEARLTLSTPLAPGPMALTAQCVSREDGVRGGKAVRTYGLRLLDLEAVDPRLTEKLYRLFNRRGSVRIPMDSAPAAVCTHTGDEDRDKPSRAALIDISPSGAGFLVAGQLEQGLADANTVLLRFRLPGDEQVLQLAAMIQGRRLRDDGILYGVEFDAERTANFVELHDQLSEFVRRAEREHEADQVTEPVEGPEDSVVGG